MAYLSWQDTRSSLEFPINMVDLVASIDLEAARKCAKAIGGDVYIYNGEMRVPDDLTLIKKIQEHKKSDSALLLLTTNGGDPDAAFRISRYFQERYSKFSVVVSGRCKSAGTLLAIGAHELAFTPYGELGPLDVQLSKVDRFDQLQSGLAIQDSLIALEDRAINRFQKLVQDYIKANNGLLSFTSATKAASDLITQLYAPVFGRIDPEEVGARARSMRIAIDYGRRLSIRAQNVHSHTLKVLAETYPSHSFVIDRQEAAGLFKRVREASSEELALVECLAEHARFVMSGGSHATIEVLHQISTSSTTGSDDNAKADARTARSARKRNAPRTGS